MNISLKYITWVSDDQVSWTLNAAGLGPDSAVEISARPIPQEPMVRVHNSSHYSSLLHPPIYPPCPALSYFPPAPETHDMILNNHPLSPPLPFTQYMIINLSMSKNFGDIDFAHLTFPNHLRVDYVRVYQPEDKVKTGCSPPDFPTEDYINACVLSLAPPLFSRFIYFCACG